jgi:hypothetical protein
LLANPAFAHWTIVHGYFLVMGGFVLEDLQGKPLHPAIPGRHGMEWSDFVFPSITEKQIRDRSKGDALTKAIVLAQLVWFLAQCIARGASGLPLTELELITTAQALFCILIYAAWWNKPLDITCYEPVSRSNDTKEKRFGNWKPPSGILQEATRFFASSIRLEQSPRVPTFFSGSYFSGPDGPILMMVYLAGTIFGGIHCVAWNFYFLSRTEQLLWRICSAYVAASTFLALIWNLGAFTDVWMTKYFHIIVIAQTILAGLGMLVYAAARLTLLFLSFYALRDLPPDSYLTVRWTKFLPHL